MGGFHYFKPSEIDGNKSEMKEMDPSFLSDSSDLQSPDAKARPVHPLSHVDVTLMVRRKQLTLPLESEIQDRGKSDWLAKTIILIQTLWFVVQCIARGIEHLPTTELEVVTLAYIAINFGISIAWWNKPRNVDRPIRAFTEPSEPDTAQLWNWAENMFCFILGFQDRFIDLHHRRKVPIFYSGKPNAPEVVLSDLIALAVGVIFGAVHCIAWSFEFSSTTQGLLWRFSSVVIISVPFLLIVLGLGRVAYLGRLGLGKGLFSDCFFLVLSISGILYVACRFVTLVVAIMNLSSLPPGALQAVYWTNLIPHV